MTHWVMNEPIQLNDSIRVPFTLIANSKHINDGTDFSKTRS